MVQVNRIYLIFNPVHFLVDSSDGNYINNLDSVLISCLNPDIFVVLEKPL